GIRGPRPRRSGAREMRGGRPSSRALLGAVARPGLLAIGDTRRVQRGADDLVAESREVGRAAAADQYYGVLLEVVALAWDVGADLLAVRQPDARDLPQCRVRLAGRVRVHAGADTPLLRCADKRRALGLALDALAALAHELIDGWHEPPKSSSDTATVGRPAGTANRTPIVAENWRFPVWKGRYPLRGRACRQSRRAVRKASGNRRT